MKKLLLGCLLFAVIGCAALAAGVYFLVYRPVMTMLENVQRAVRYEDRLSTQDAFTPPTEPILSEEQVNKFATVQRAMLSVAGDDLQKLQDALGRIANQTSSTQDWQAFTQELVQFGDAISLMRNVRDAQVQAMNDQRLSLQEYQWIRSVFFAALLPTQSIERLQSMAQEGSVTQEQITEVFEGSGLAASAHPSAALVEPFREEAVKWGLLYAIQF
jgi:hypothetical protein